MTTYTNSQLPVYEEPVAPQKKTRRNKPVATPPPPAEYVEVISAPVEVASAEILPETTTQAIITEPKKSRSRKSKTVPVPSDPEAAPAPPVEVPVKPEPLPPPPDSEIPATEEEPTTPIDAKKKRVLSKQLVASEFDEVYKELESVLGREHKKLLRRIKQLKTSTFRALRVNTHERRADPTVSGFMKPIRVSADMASFINVSADDEVRRVDVTKQLCDYIRQNNLQNPQNRREILPDHKLKTLLRISDNEREPLTYYNLQKKIKFHVQHPEK
jgi:chromatin remodeling complex protein RSC6